jgi:CBS domain-containing protein
MARPQIETRIGDLPTRGIPAIPEHLTMAAARKVAVLKQTPILFVERARQLVGLLDERALAEFPDDANVGASMAPIGPCLDPAMPVARARELFAWSRVSMLPVGVGAFLLGGVSRGDVEQAVARQHRTGGVARRAPRSRAAA